MLLRRAAVLQIIHSTVADLLRMRGASQSSLAESKKGLKRVSLNRRNQDA